MKNKYLITGGAGFIGSNLADYLLKRGQEVVVFDDLSSGKRENLDLGTVELIEGDIRDLKTLAKAMHGCRAVFHLAAIGSVPRSVVDPLLFFDVNVNGTVNVLEAARKHGIKRLVFASSGSVYGGCKNGPLQEHMPIAPASPYAASKATCEAYMKVYTKSYDMETVSLRYFNIFGPRQDLDRTHVPVIPAFVKSIATGQEPVIYGDGYQTRDFCHVDNVCLANWLAATAPKECCNGSSINIGCGESHTVNEIFSLLTSLFHTAIPAQHHDTRIGDTYHSVADITLARQVLSYEPCVSFMSGLHSTAMWYAHRISNPSY